MQTITSLPPDTDDYYDGIRSSQNLLRKAREGDKDAQTKAIEENAGLIWSVARRFYGRGVDLDDLYQLGCIGFIKALNGYDPAFGTQFSTYAVPKIAGEMRRFLRDDGTIKVSRGLKEQAYKIKLAKNELEQKLGREPTISELSAYTGFESEDIATAETASAPVESISGESGDGAFSLEDVLTDAGAEERLLEQVSLRQAIDKLPEREKSVIALRYYRGLTQENAARMLGVSQVQISRLERRALGRLKEHLTDA